MFIKFAKIVSRAGFRIAALVSAYALITVSDLDLAPATEAAIRIWPHALAFAVLGAIFDLILRVGRAPWRFTSVHDLLVIVRSAVVTGVAFIIFLALFDKDSRLAWPMLALAGILDMALFASAIIIRRAVHERALRPSLALSLKGEGAVGTTNLLLLGGLDAADAFLREAARKPDGLETPVGLISTEIGDVGREIRGVKVLAWRENADEIFEDFGRDQGSRALLFLDDAYVPADIDSDLLGRLRGQGVRLLRRSRISEMHDRVGRSELREFNIEELLARPPVELDIAGIKKLVSGRRVLVTGAGGSIGSEICRQVSALGCAHLAMIEHSEFALFNIDMEIRAHHQTLSCNPIICDIRDQKRLSHWVAQEGPDIIFHAAALKHVPLMEQHPCESVLTNVVGTWNVAQAAMEQGVAHMVFISTDKAVDPGNVMGATKRLAESVVKAHRARNVETRFSVVRFGNVLGSAGSVVPTFLSQIERGGPLTVTHPDVERYFMTIPEAVQLVLHATAKSATRQADQSGVFVLDMGAPVKIIDMAQRLIELSGKVPGRDIEIQITGLRPGEKLTEELVDSTEEGQDCDPGVLLVVDRHSPQALGRKEVSALEAMARTGDSIATRELIFSMLKAVRTGTPNVTHLRA